MTEISKRFEQLISSAHKKLAENNQMLPVKTDRGILVGDVLIESHENLKNLYKKDRLIYREISLNDVAIRLANMLAKNTHSLLCDKIYRADQEYGRWFIECQVLKQTYHNAVKNKDFDRADVCMARYEESKLKAETAKKTVMVLIGL